MCFCLCIKNEIYDKWSTCTWRHIWDNGRGAESAASLSATHICRQFDTLRNVITPNIHRALIAFAFTCDRAMKMTNTDNKIGDNSNATHHNNLCFALCRFFFLRAIFLIYNIRGIESACACVCVWVYNAKRKTECQFSTRNIIDPLNVMCKFFILSVLLAFSSISIFRLFCCFVLFFPYHGRRAMFLPKVVCCFRSPNATRPPSITYWSINWLLVSICLARIHTHSIYNTLHSTAQRTAIYR